MRELKYREAVSKLMNGELSFNERLGNWAAGLCGESAELDSLVDDAITFDELVRNKLDKLIDEASDCRWYATAFTITLNAPVWWFIGIPNTTKEWSPQKHTQLMMRYAGQINDVVKKVIYHKHPFDAAHRTKILGLLDLYIRVYNSFLFNINTSDNWVKEYNVKKLSARYEGLMFTTAQSLNRNNEIMSPE